MSHVDGAHSAKVLVLFQFCALFGTGARKCLEHGGHHFYRPIVFVSLGTCCDSTVGRAYHDDRKCRKQHGVLVFLAPKVSGRLYKIGLS